MRHQLTRLEFVEILSTPSLLSPLAIAMFQALYAFERHRAPASQIARIIGTKGHPPLNLEVGRVAKRIGKLYDIGVSERANRTYRWWDLFYTGETEDGLFVWELRPELASALEETGLTGIVPLADEIDGLAQPLMEGTMRQVRLNVFERNPIARRRCIEHWGSACCVCRLSLAERYGVLGEGFIHVHHLTPISSQSKAVLVDPVNDLRPVCPNCHAMLHQRTPPLTIEELKNIVDGSSVQ